MSTEETVAAGVLRLADVGFAVLPGLVSGATCLALRNEALRRDAAGELTVAGTGRHHQLGDIRGDRTGWLDATSSVAAEDVFRALMETLRLAMNESLVLGLFHYEGHYAVYPAGAIYARHVDRFAAHDRRVVSCILYLNADWLASDGGALRLHDIPIDVLPVEGTVVLFLSDGFPHEVLVATRPRIAISGWFATR